MARTYTIEMAGEIAQSMFNMFDAIELELNNRIGGLILDVERLQGELDYRDGMMRDLEGRISDLESGVVFK